MLETVQIVHRFVKYTPRKVFNNLAQSVVDVGGAADENPLSSVIAETRKLRGNSYYGYQTKERSKLTMTKFLGEEKTNPWSYQ